MEAIEWADVAHEATTLGLEHLPDRLRCLFWVTMGLGIGKASAGQSGIQLLRLSTPRRSVKNRPRTSPTWFSTCPFSQPDAAVQATGCTS